jgi:hypothetical protein
MKITIQEGHEEARRRVNEVVHGTSMSPREAQVIIEVIRAVYFASTGDAPLRHG